MSDHGHDHGYRAQSRRALGIVLALTAAYTVCEIVGGWLTGSLALLADAGHMLGDTAALALALVAAWLAGRPATPERSFGYRRAEILAALVNGVALAVIAIWVFIEAVRRLDNPKEILGGWMLVVALIGLVVNAVAAAILARADRGNLNVQAALRHVFADLAGSVGVAVAAVVVLATGWERADPVASMAIGVLILASSWSIVRDSVSILLEATHVRVSDALGACARPSRRRLSSAPARARAAPRAGVRPRAHDAPGRARRRAQRASDRASAPPRALALVSASATLVARRRHLVQALEEPARSR
jgi:cobalt-zinc-cadmium efflux system protein